METRFLARTLAAAACLLRTAHARAAMLEATFDDLSNPTRGSTITDGGIVCSNPLDYSGDDVFGVSAANGSEPVASFAL